MVRVETDATALRQINFVEYGSFGHYLEIAQTIGSPQHDQNNVDERAPRLTSF